MTRLLPPWMIRRIQEMDEAHVPRVQIAKALHIRHIIPAQVLGPGKRGTFTEVQMEARRRQAVRQKRDELGRFESE